MASHRRRNAAKNTTWKAFIQSHLAVLAGIDFFTVEVLSWRGLVTYYVAWAGYILRLVFHSSGEPPRQLGRDHAPPRPRMDATNGAQRDRRELGIPGSAAVRTA